MATIAKFRVGDTLRAIAFPLDLGTDPVTGAQRTISPTDTIVMVMRNRNAGTPTAITRVVQVLSSGPYTIKGVQYDQICYWKAEDGDFTEGGIYDLVFRRTNSVGDSETIPVDADLDYQFEVDWTPSDAGYRN